ncbi:MAG TPA: GGDEF domain-containing protein [Rhizomicrobium sp.]|jgi:diguanylate cyclase (GGDEF)-like protein|nr:GGDEF domain-containing protein [Rhizomicrobium sp.]
MKAERISARSSRAMSAAVALQMDTSSMLDTIGAVLPPNVSSIPPAELTPRVRDTIMAFLREMDGLKQELNQTRTRLDEVEKTADLDAVLPILNRRAFIRELTRYIAFTTRYSTPASLIYFDLNHLKQTNDTLGHAAGDALLAKFAKILLSHVRESDCVGRMGGDEFAILLSHASQGQALKKAMGLADFAIKNPAQWNGHAVPVSFAYGAFELKAGDKAEAAIAKADEAMYAQKKSRKTPE